MAKTLEKHKIEAVFEVEIEHFLRREGPAAGRAHQLWGLLELCVSQISRRRPAAPVGRGALVKGRTRKGAFFFNAARIVHLRPSFLLPRLLSLPSS